MPPKVNLKFQDWLGQNIDRVDDIGTLARNLDVERFLHDGKADPCTKTANGAEKYSIGDGKKKWTWTCRKCRNTFEAFTRNRLENVLKAINEGKEVSRIACCGHDDCKLSPLAPTNADTAAEDYLINDKVFCEAAKLVANLEEAAGAEANVEHQTRDGGEVVHGSLNSDVEDEQDEDQDGSQTEDNSDTQGTGDKTEEHCRLTGEETNDDSGNTQRSEGGRGNARSNPSSRQAKRRDVSPPKSPNVDDFADEVANLHVRDKSDDDRSSQGDSSSPRPTASLNTCLSSTTKKQKEHSSSSRRNEKDSDDSDDDVTSKEMIEVS